jgi:uncharacterized protein (DUF433 family)
MMPSTHSEAERPRVQSAELTKHYRAIGPAAIRAALICTAKKRKKTLPAAKAA